jgi:hypothetical protein
LFCFFLDEGKQVEFFDEVMMEDEVERMHEAYDNESSDFTSDASSDSDTAAAVVDKKKTLEKNKEKDEPQEQEDTN